MSLNKITGFALLLVGAGLFYYGWQAQASVASNVSNAITGSPSDKTMWLLSLGVLAASTGVYALIFRGVH